MTKEPTPEQLRQQIRKVVSEYTQPGHEINAATALLSGMSLCANFLAKLEGSQTVRPADVLAAVNDVAKDMGLLVYRLGAG